MTTPPRTSEGLLDLLRTRRSGIGLYGLAPPKLATDQRRLAEIAARQVHRLQRLRPDGVIVYDLQDEPGRTSEPRPFPFLPTVDPLEWADALTPASVPAIVYRRVGPDRADTFARWLATVRRAEIGGAVVLVGNPTARPAEGLALRDAYALCREEAPDVMVGGIAIAERHARRLDEHERILEKMAAGCSFFVTQAVYDVSATKSLISDVHLALAERQLDPVPLLLTFSPCASTQTLRFMKWLGIAFPRWLENELRVAADPLRTSVELCLSIFDEAWTFATDRGVPLGVNIESVSIRKAEIEASEALFSELRARMGTSPARLLVPPWLPRRLLRTLDLRELAVDEPETRRQRAALERALGAHVAAYDGEARGEPTGLCVMFEAAPLDDAARALIREAEASCAGVIFVAYRRPLTPRDKTIQDALRGAP